MTHYRAAHPRVSPFRRSSPWAHQVEQLAWVAAAAVATAVSAQVSVTLPGTAIPFTLQPVAVMMAGVVLGARLGAVSQIAYLALGVAGAAAFAWSPVLLPGVGRLLGPTGGFLLAFPLAAFVAGALSARLGVSKVPKTAASMLVGTAVLHLVGWAWALTLLAEWPAASTLAAFVIADVVKMAIAAPVAARVARVRTR